MGRSGGILGLIGGVLMVSIGFIRWLSLVAYAQNERIIPPFRCQNCGAITTGVEAQAMIRAGQKVRCQCNYNLTALAWAAMEGR